MAHYSLFGIGKNMFDAVSPGGGIDYVRLSDALLYVTATEFGILNGDGSKTFFTGTDFVFDEASGAFSSGTITKIEHFTNGQFTDRITGLDLPYFYLGDTLYGETLALVAFQGNDLIDASIRLGGAALPVVFNGYEGNDTILGGAGADRLTGGNGADRLRGNDGNDWLIGDFSDAYVAVGVDGKDVLFGGNGNDKLNGGYDADHLSGGAGNDILLGGAGKDALRGGAGIDTAIFEASFSQLAITRAGTGFNVKSKGVTEWINDIERIGTDTGTFEFNTTTNAWTRINSTIGVELYDRTATRSGTAGDDVLQVADFTVRVIKGLAGNDDITAYNVYGTLVLGGDGNDRIDGFGRLYGGNGNDIIDGSDEIYGGAGNDLLATKAGNDFVAGGTGTDSALFFQSFADLNIKRTAAGFTVQTRQGTDTYASVERIVADEGTYAYVGGNWVKQSDVTSNETIDPAARLNGTDGVDSFRLQYTGQSAAYGLGGDDEIVGSERDDVIFGGAGNDSLGGDFSPGLGQFSASEDRVYGGDGNDSLGGGHNNDHLYGGNGDDVIGGGNGDDILTGGAGADRFVFNYNNDRFIRAEIGKDVVTDFQVGVDTLEFSFRIVQPPGTGSVSMELTTDGWLLTTNRGGSVLLEGVTTAGLTLDDLLI